MPISPSSSSSFCFTGVEPKQNAHYHYKLLNDFYKMLSRSVTIYKLSFVRQVKDMDQNSCLLTEKP